MAERFEVRGWACVGAASVLLLLADCSDDAKPPAGIGGGTGGTSQAAASGHGGGMRGGGAHAGDAGVRDAASADSGGAGGSAGNAGEAGISTSSECPLQAPAAAPGVPDVSQFPPAMAAPWSVAHWFAGKNASPPLRNQLAALNLVRGTGACTSATPYLGPAEWFRFTPPESWDGAVPLPAYIVATDYLGAFDPRPGATRWTDGWTVSINGNKAVWDFAGGEGSLSAVTAPSADGDCPVGTTRATTFVAEFGGLSRDELGLFSGAAAAGDYDVCDLPERLALAGTVTLTNDNVYRLQGRTLVGTGDDTNPTNDVATVLAIEPGTLLYGGIGATLVITRGAKIAANGTAANPIVMTSQQQLLVRFDGLAATDPMGERAEWGGIVLVGKARDNRCRGAFAGCNTLIQAASNVFGAGDDDTDDSGSIEYLVVRNAGATALLDPAFGPSGLTFFAVGSATQVRYVQAHMGSREGMLFFGSTVSAAYIALTDNANDGLSWGHGYRGAMQHVFVRSGSDFADRSIDARNDTLSPNEQPVSFPLLANFTMVGPADATFTPDTETRGGGILLRRGTKVQIWNTILQGAATHGIDIDDAGKTDTYSRVQDPHDPGTDLVIRNTIIDVPMSRAFAIE